MFGPSQMPPADGSFPTPDRPAISSPGRPPKRRSMAPIFWATRRMKCAVAWSRSGTCFMDAAPPENSACHAPAYYRCRRRKGLQTARALQSDLSLCAAALHDQLKRVAKATKTISNLLFFGLLAQNPSEPGNGLVSGVTP